MALLPDTKVRIKVVDTETTSAEGDPDWVHTPNKVVMYGVLDPDWVEAYRSVVTEQATTCRSWLDLDSEHADSVLMVGHNLGFDIGHLVKEGVLTQVELARRVRIWDTMVAEYILSGQRAKFVSLEDACLRHSIVFKKNPFVSAMFAEGKGADAVPTATLSEYLVGDLRATYDLFLKQYAEAESSGKLSLILAMMEFRQATIDMRMNGVCVDKKALDATRDICEKEVALATIVMAGKTSEIELNGFFPYEMKGAELDVAKPQQLASYLWGGKYKWKDKKLVGKYKNGNDKFKTEEMETEYRGMVKQLGLTIPEMEDKSADEETLEAIIEAIRKPVTIATTAEHDKCCALLESLLLAVLAYRKAMKVLSTYVEPTDIDYKRFGKLYPIIHTTSTNTGRTSCAKPNLQNVPKNSLGLYRKAIVPEFPVKSLVEFDYKQLEVIALACLSGDKQLVEDLLNGVDMHIELFKQVHGRVPTSTERTDFKRAVFCLIYGGGVNAIAKQGNTNRGKARVLKEVFQKRYPDTIKLRGTVGKEIDSHSYVVEERKYGIPHRAGHWESPTGRTYCFEQYLMEDIKVNPRTGQRETEKVCKFSTQEIANYPIQGLATADMVPLMVGQLYRFVYSKEMEIACKGEGLLPKLRMTVHDSALAELWDGTLSAVIGLMKTFLETLPIRMRETFALSTGGLEFKVGVSVGKNWEDMEDYKESK